jgi:hypothetical protein
LAYCQRSYWSINSVNDTGNACIAGVIDTGEVGDLYCPVSMTLVSHFFLVLLTQVKLSKTIKMSLTGVVDTGEELLTGVNDTGNACFAGVVDAGEALK